MSLYKLAGQVIPGPDNIRYGERPTIGTRLDFMPQRQGLISMDWSFAILSGEEYAAILSLWQANQQGIDVTYYNEQGVWATRRWYMQKPVAAKRTAFLATGVTIHFTPVYYSGTPLTTASGTSPGADRFPTLSNPPPKARISYTASVWGDPEITIRLDGSGSSDADGVITAYNWADNEDAFRQADGFTGFDPPHEATTAQAIFVYQYFVGMPNPVISLTVTDNAGQTNKTSVQINVPALVGTSAINGKTFAAVGGGTVYVSIDGGLSFTEITGFDGQALSVACPPGTIVWGTNTGKIYRMQLATMPEYIQVHAFTTANAEVTSLAASKTQPGWLFAGTNKGDAALSISRGRGWLALPSPGIAINQAAFSIDNEQQIWLAGTDNAGAKMRVSSDRGQSWSNLDSQVPGAGEGRGIAASSRIWYIGLQGNTVPLRANGLAVTGVTTPADIQGFDMESDGKIFAVDAQGRAYRIVEAQVTTTKQLGTGAAYHVAMDPENDAIALFATDDGLWKTLDDLGKVGQLALAGVGLAMVDFMPPAQPPVAEVIVPTWGGGVGVDGVWYYRKDIGWALRSGDRTAGLGLPEGKYWSKAISDPNDPDTWIIVGNTTDNGPDYYHVTRANPQQVCMQYTLNSPVSPVWITHDAGLTWRPVPLYIPKHRDVHEGAADWYNGARIAHVSFDRAGTGNLVVMGSALLQANSTGNDGIGAGPQYFQSNGVTGNTEVAAWFVSSDTGGLAQIGGPSHQIHPHIDFNYTQVGVSVDDNVAVGAFGGRAGLATDANKWGVWSVDELEPTRMAGSPDTSLVWQFADSWAIDPNGFFAIYGDGILYGTTDYQVDSPTAKVNMQVPSPQQIRTFCSLKDGMRMIVSDGTGWRILKLDDPMHTSTYAVDLPLNGYASTPLISTSHIVGDAQTRTTCAVVLRTKDGNTPSLMTTLVFDEAGWQEIDPPNDQVIFSLFAVLPLVRNA